MTWATLAGAVLFPVPLSAIMGQAAPDDQRTDVSTAARTPTADWAEAGTYPIAPGVHRVPLPLPTDGLRAVNVYVLETARSLVLIDGGWALAESQAALAAALAALGGGLGDIRHFLVTHVHRDHYTQAVQLRREFGSKVSLGAGEAEAIAVLLAGGSRPLEPLLGDRPVAGERADRVPIHAGATPAGPLLFPRQLRVNGRGLAGPALAPPGCGRGSGRDRRSWTGRAR